MLLYQRHYALVLRLDRRDRLNISLRCRQSRSPAHLAGARSTIMDSMIPNGPYKCAMQVLLPN